MMITMILRSREISSSKTENKWQIIHSLNYLKMRELKDRSKQKKVQQIFLV